MMRASVFRLSPFLLLAAMLVAASVLLVHDARPAVADHGEEEIYWTATLNVKAWAAANLARGCTNVESGKHCSATSNLTEDEITYGGTSYDVDLVRHLTGDNKFSVAYNAPLPALVKEVAVLYVDGVAHPLSSATATALQDGGEQLEFVTSSVSWSAGDTVTLELKRPAAPPSGVELSTETLPVTEGGSATFTVALSADPGTDATVTLLKTQHNQPGVGADDHRWNVSGATVAPETLTFTAGTSGNWSTAQTVTVTGADDPDSRSEQLVVLILSPNRTEYDYVYVGEGNGSYNLNANGQYVWAGTGEGEYNYQQVDGYDSPGGTSSSITGVYVTVADDEGPGAPVWTARLTVPDAGGGNSGCSGDSGWPCNSPSILTDHDFQVDGTAVSVTCIQWLSDLSRYSLGFSTSNDALKALNFCIGSVAYSLSSLNAEHRMLTDRSASWSVGDTVSLRIASACPTTGQLVQNSGGGQTDRAPVAIHQYAALIAQMYEWRNDPEWSHQKAHTDRWDRALLAFGVAVADNTLTPMTAAEAQGFADRGWERWVEVAEALWELQNQAPTVSNALADVTIVNESGSHEVSLAGVFDDADGDSLTISAASSDEATATASVASDGSSLTVTARLRGTATITVTADDGKGGTAEDSFTVTVKAAPLVAQSLADVDGLEMQRTRDVSLIGVFSDADGDALTITASSSDEAIATAAVAPDGSDLTFTGVAEGTATVTVTAQDSDGNSVSDAFQVEVVQRFASLIPQMYQWRNDPQWSHRKSHTDRWDRALLALGETVADTTLTPMTAAEAQALADQSWGVRWVPVAAALWQIEGGGQQETPNAAPTVSSAISDATIVNESGTQTVSLAGVFDDTDGDSLTITAASSDEAKATVSVAAGGSSLTVTAQARGTATITVTANDGNGGTVEDAFTVTVKAAPGVASDIADVSGLEAGSTQEVSLSGVFNDADGDALSVTASSDDDAKATVAVASDGSKLTLTGVGEGTATVTVTARDSDGNTVSDAFDVSVVAPPPPATPNQAPTVSSAIGDATIVNEGGSQQVSLAGVFDDADGDSLTMSAASSDEAVATVSVASDGSSLTVAAKSRGTATITVTANDGNGGTVEDSFTVTVKAAPVVASAIADIAGMTVGDSQDIDLTEVFSDADGDALTFTADTSDFAIAEALLFQGILTVVGLADGTATITVTARDADGNTVSDTFDVKVVGPPTPVSGLSCVAQTDRVLFSWDAPQWSGAKAYAYDYDLTRPDGGREQSRLQGYPAVSARGEYQAGQQASISVKAVYELTDGSEVSSEAVSLSCTVAE